MMAANYAEEIVPLAPNDLATLTTVLRWVLQGCNHTLIDFQDPKEVKQLHMIAPIVWAVVQSLPDATVQVDQPMDGEYIAFVLVRGKQRVCVVQAIDWQFRQAIADALRGCEAVAAALDASHQVDAVVTDAQKWIFIKRMDGEIRYDQFNALQFDETGAPQHDQLNAVTGKLLSMLKRS